MNEAAGEIPPPAEAQQNTSVSNAARTYFTDPIDTQGDIPVSRLTNLTARFGEQKAQTFVDFVSALAVRLAAKPSQRESLKQIYDKYHPEIYDPQRINFSSEEVHEIDGLSKSIYAGWKESVNSIQEPDDDSWSGENYANPRRGTLPDNEFDKTREAGLYD